MRGLDVDIGTLKLYCGDDAIVDMLEVLASHYYEDVDSLLDDYPDADVTEYKVTIEKVYDK